MGVYRRIPTCAVDTAQNSCQPRIKAYGGAVTINDTSDFAVDRDYTAVDGRGR